MVFFFSHHASADSLEFVSTIQNRKVGTSHRVSSAALRSARHNAPRLHGTCVAREARLESRRASARRARGFLGARASGGRTNSVSAFPSIVRTRAMGAPGGQPAFSGNTGGRSKGNMYGEAGRGKGHAQRRGNGGGDGDWKNQKSRLQMALEEDAHEATLGYANFTEGDERLGWLMNVAAVRTTPSMDIPTNDTPAWRSHLKPYFSRARVLATRDRARRRPTRAPTGSGTRGTQILFFAFLNFSAKARGSTRRRTPSGGDPRTASHGLPRSASRRTTRVAVSSTHRSARPPRSPRTPTRFPRSARSPRFFLPESHFGETRNDDPRTKTDAIPRSAAIRRDPRVSAAPRVFSSFAVDRRPPCKTPRRERSSAR